MYNKELQKQVKEMFRGLHDKSEKVISSSSTYSAASERVINMVSSKVSAECEGYLVDMYTSFVEKIKQDDFFRNPEHLNAFYRLDLKEKLNDKYHFEIDSLDAYKKGIDHKEINQLYTAVGTAAGTFAAGGILKFVISRVENLNIPFIIIIAGAAIAAIAASTRAAYLYISNKNKREFRRAVGQFLDDLENDILNWFIDIEEFFESQVRILYTQKI